MKCWFNVAKARCDDRFIAELMIGSAAVISFTLVIMLLCAQKAGERQVVEARYSVPDWDSSSSSLVSVAGAELDSFNSMSC